MHNNETMKTILKKNITMSFLFEKAFPLFLSRLYCWILLMLLL